MSSTCFSARRALSLVALMASGLSCPAGHTVEHVEPPQPVPTVRPVKPSAPELVLHDEAGSVSLLLAPNAASMVARCGDGSLAWVPHSGEVVPIAHRYGADALLSMAWAPSGALLAIARFDGFTLWASQKGKAPMHAALPAGASAKLAPTLAWASSGRYLAFSEGRLAHECADPAAPPSRMHIWDAGASKWLATLTGPACARVTWSTRDDLFATSTGFGQVGNGGFFAGLQVKLWRPGGDTPIASLAGHSPLFDPTGRHLALVIGHPDKEPQGSSTQVYRVKDWGAVATVKGAALAWSEDGTRLVTTLSRYRSANVPSGAGFRIYRIPDGAMLHDGAAPSERDASPFSISGLAAFGLDSALADGSSSQHTVSLHELTTGASNRAAELPIGTTVEAVLAGGRVWLLEVEGEPPALLNVVTGARLHIAGRAHNGRCAVALFDEGGHHDGDVRGVITYRSGDSLVRDGELFKTMRRPGLWRLFMRAASSAGTR